MDAGRRASKTSEVGMKNSRKQNIEMAKLFLCNLRNTFGSVEIKYFTSLNHQNFEANLGGGLSARGLMLSWEDEEDITMQLEVLINALEAWRDR